MSTPPGPDEPHDRLDVIMEDLRETPETPSSIQREVWHRIALAETDAAPASAGGWLTSLSQIFARPSFAVTFVAACGMLGLFLAEQKVAKSEAARSTQIARSYLMLINPLVAEDSTSIAASSREETR